MNDRNDSRRNADIVARIDKASSREDVASVLAEIAALYGFRNWFVRDIPVGDRPVVHGGVYISNVDRSVTANLDRVFGHRDIGLLGRLKGPFSPATWHIKDLDRTASAANESIWNVLHDSGMDYGICFPALDVAGHSRVICFTGVREPLPESEIEQLDYMVIQIHGRVSAIGRTPDEFAPQLATLEVECLSLAAAGHDIDTIARKMELSVRTVQHLSVSACRKLDVSSIEHAVAVALRLGIIR